MQIAGTSAVSLELVRCPSELFIFPLLDERAILAVRGYLEADHFQYLWHLTLATSTTVDPSWEYFPLQFGELGGFIVM